MRQRLSLAWYAFARGVVELVCRLMWRVEILDKDKLPRQGPYVIAPVHRSNIDTLLAGCLTHRRIRFMGKDSLWKYRWSGALFSSLGGFPVHRGTPDREALRTCEEAVKGGEPVVLFPEGTRQSGPKLHPLFEGAAFVAARTGVPLVPVGIGGSEWAMPKGSRGIHPVKVVMVVGDPILPPDRGESGRLSRRAVKEMTDQLTVDLQALFDRALEKAGRG
ncbi:MAG TPA: lysophospholipid acyltransferase family protein [Acidimicrobiales bacterium]|nr:lysophospholipid acyltransferase family protein [Acidimicrobiales bacterium]